MIRLEMKEMKKYELEDKVRISRWCWMHARCYKIYTLFETRLTIILYIKIHMYGTLELLSITRVVYE